MTEADPVEPSLLRQRLLLLREMPGMGVGVLTGAAVLLGVRALLPVAAAVTTMTLVDRLVSGASFVGALVLFVLLLLGGQLLEHVLEPLRYLAVRRVDGAHRRRVAAAACGPDGIAHLEAPDYQDDLRRAAGEPDNWTEGTPGAGAWAQLSLLFAYLGVYLAAAVVARDAPWLALVLLVVLLACRAVQRREFIRPVRAWAAALVERRRAEYWTAVLTEPQTAKEVRVFGLHQWAADRHRESAEAHLRPFRAAKLTKLRRQPVWLLAITVITALSLYVLGDLAVRGDISTGQLAGDLAAVTGMIGLTVVNPGTLDLEAGIPPLLALQRLRRTTPSDRPPIDRPPPGNHPLIRFEDVWFNYPGTDRPILRGLDLTIRSGEVLALVGLNGAGKTTIVKLLAGLYQPGRGRITADGVDLRELDSASWRQRLSVVFQDFLHYELSAADNVTLGQPADPEPDALRAAAAGAGITDLIRDLPQGWQTPLSAGRTDGVDVSGGQWQRVALARALYAMDRGARVLVLDEPTAHLDVRTEFAVFRQLMEVARDASVVLISHRLSTVRGCDRIVLIADGVVQESGSHDELLAAGGRYARLFQIQAERVLGGTA